MTNNLSADDATQGAIPNTGSTRDKPAKPAWYRATVKYGQPQLRKSLWQMFNTLVPYGFLWALMIYTIERKYPYWVTLALAFVAGGILVRTFILFHDCCHGSFFRSRRANAILGYVTGILTFTDFEDWRHAHNKHHATAGDLDRRGMGDIWTMTTEEYAAASRRKRLAYRIYRNPFVLFGPGSALLFLFLQRFSKKETDRRVKKSVRMTNVALLLIVAAASWTIGFQVYLSIQLPIILTGGALGLWLFYIQHQFENAYWVRHASWDLMEVALAGSSYFKLPKILQWFTGNIGLHHVHHVRPGIPNYHLQPCHDAIPALRAVKAITLKSSIRSLSLALYDETSKKLVSFGSVRASTKESEPTMN
jgi:omega-6 fatty acid desaturase (delta-12 desaturase)